MTLAQQVPRAHSRETKWRYQTDYELLHQRATASLSTTPRPFLRWAGSKQKVLHQLIEHLPQRFNRYIEPFLGGGALYFCLQPNRARLSDSCVALIDTYAAVRNNAPAVKRFASQLDALDEELYYEIRRNRSTSQFKQAAEFIFLNHSCWNGLYRVNSRGQFNVPYGRPASSRSFDSENLTACASLLQSKECTITAEDFRIAMSSAQDGDLVFLDPPYVTGHNNNGFVDYNEKIFRWKDQESLADLACNLAARGVHVLVTNAHHSAILNLYQGFSRHSLTRTSTLAGNMDARGTVTEAILTSY